MAPFARPTQGRAQTFASVRKSAVQSTENLKGFREVWKSDQTQDILARSKESAEKDPDLSKAKDVAAYGW